MVQVHLVEIRIPKKFPTRLGSGDLSLIVGNNITDASHDLIISVGNNIMYLFIVH